MICFCCIPISPTLIQINLIFNFPLKPKITYTNFTLDYKCEDHASKPHSNKKKPSEKHANLSNVKKFPKYERFGENVRYFAIEEWRLFTDAIANQEHKLMMFLIYETRCRVGEFVQNPSQTS